MKKTLLTLLTVIFICPPSSFASPLTPDDYMVMIRKVAKHRFGGLALNPTVSTSYAFDGTDNRGLTVGASINLPVWNREQKSKDEAEAIEFQKAGAELVTKLRITINKIALYRTKAKYFKSIMEEEGITAAKAFIEMEEKLIEQKAFEIQYRQELDVMIAPLDGTAITPHRVKQINVKEGDQL